MTNFPTLFKNTAMYLLDMFGENGQIVKEDDDYVSLSQGNMFVEDIRYFKEDISGDTYPINSLRETYKFVFYSKMDTAYLQNGMHIMDSNNVKYNIEIIKRIELQGVNIVYETICKRVR